MSRPPRTAQLIGGIDYGSGLGGGDYRLYFLSGNRRKKRWHVWEETFDDIRNQKIYDAWAPLVMIAGGDVRSVAFEVMQTAISVAVDEIQSYGDLLAICPHAEGILSYDEIRLIIGAVLSRGGSTSG